MRILLLNQDWFAQEWREAGHEVMSCGNGDQFDHKLPTPLSHIDEIINQSGLSGSPDLIVYHDNSMPLSVLGIEDTEIPVLFYSVDSHHHAYWHKHFALLTDKTLVAHKDYVEHFTKEGVSAEWLPLWASRKMEPSDDKRHQAVFVGTMDPELNPERVVFFEKLKQIAPVEVLTGEFWKIYPHAQIVLNQTVKGDLNFRVFESLISGSMLLTEKSGNGLPDLFNDGQHLVLYEKNNVEEAADLINKYLSNLKLCREIGAAGRDETLKKHTAEHRANDVLKMVTNLEKTTAPYRSYAGMMAYVCASVRYEKISAPHSALCVTSACKLIERALVDQEPITDFLTLYAVLSCMEFDRIMNNNTGLKLLRHLCDAYPNSHIFRMSTIRGYLNAGERDKALELVQGLGIEDNLVFESSEIVVRKILDMKLSKKDINFVYGC